MAEEISTDKEIKAVTIFSTFLFSDTDEIDLLIIKIETEKYLVKDWIVVEGAYTFRGKQRNLILKNLVKSDIRLKPYAHRLHILECHENFFENFKYPKKLLILKYFELLLRKMFSIHFASTLRSFQESRFFYAEKSMRNFAASKIFELSNTELDWVLISDVDEMLNTEDLEIRNSLSSILISNNLFVMLNRQRFMFDFDNIDSQQRFTPLINISLIRSGKTQISDFRHRSDGAPKVNLPYVVEYCFCMSLDAITRKLSNFSHIGTTKDFIDFAMKVNGTLLMPDSGLAEIRWLEKIDIFELKVPAYVKKHISTLKTNNIDLNYRENRKEIFSEIFGK